MASQEIFFLTRYNIKRTCSQLWGIDIANRQLAFSTPLTSMCHKVPLTLSIGLKLCFERPVLWHMMVSFQRSISQSGHVSTFPSIMPPFISERPLCCTSMCACGVVRDELLNSLLICSSCIQSTTFINTKINERSWRWSQLRTARYTRQSRREIIKACFKKL